MEATFNRSHSPLKKREISKLNGFQLSQVNRLIGEFFASSLTPIDQFLQHSFASWKPPVGELARSLIVGRFAEP